MESEVTTEYTPASRNDGPFLISSSFRTVETLSVCKNFTALGGKDLSEPPVQTNSDKLKNPALFMVEISTAY